MVTKTADTYSVESISPEICLEFCNTVSSRAYSGNRKDNLHNYSDLIAWSEQKSLLSPRTARRLRAHAKAKPAQATRSFTHAIELREAIYHLVSARTRGLPPSPKDLKVLNKATAIARAHTSFAIDRDGYKWRWDTEPDALDQITWHIAIAATELLTSTRITSLRECASKTCTWLFVDTTKNHSRRWCDMNDCGNRAKARRHYAKIKAALRITSRRQHPT